MSKYSSRVKKLERVQLVLIAVCVIALIIWAIVFTRPKVTEYNIKDECGPIGGSVSHSIDDDDSCVNICSAYCQSLVKKYHDSEFTLSALECNSCKCYCKE